jgi:hypothetical protein
MMRIVLTILVPLLLPGVLYYLWLRATGRIVAGSSLATLPWPWLIASGVVLTALTLVVVSVHYGNSPQGAYVPPRVQDGKVVPGHVVPRPTP